MNIEEMLKNIDPKTLSSAIQRMSSALTPQQMQQVQAVIKSTSKDELSKKLSNLNTADLQKELKNNPNLAKQLANNPELMQKLKNVIK